MTYFVGFMHSDEIADCMPGNADRVDWGVAK